MKSVLSGILGLLLCICFGCGGATQKTPFSVEPPSATDIQVTITSPTASVGTTFSVTAQASGSTIAGWEVDVDSVKAYTAGAVNSINASITTSAGTHTVLVKAWDSKGNTGQKNVQISAKAPTPTIAVSIASPQPSASVEATYSVSASASGATIAGWEIDVDGRTAYLGPAGASLVAILTASAGNHSMMVKAWDSAGNTGKQTVEFSVSAPPPPPTIAVTITSPKPSASVGTTFSVAASAAGATIAGWEVDVDGSKAYTTGAGASLSAILTTTAGTHSVLVKAWDSSGDSGSHTVEISAATPPKNPLPTPPSTAVVFSDIEQITSGWGTCGTSSCAGGSGSGSFWQAFNQTTPAMSGSSMEMYRDGVYANALWWRHLGAQNAATNMLWDFYMQLDDASTSGVQALEYDLYQFLGGYNYMVGSQCEYPAGVWETWDEANDKWIKTTIACKKFSTNTWHHIQWYVTLDHAAHTYTYVTLVVDGTAYSVNQTYGAKHNGWHDNIGVQWQLDVNKSGGGYHEWVDKASFTVW